MKCFFKRMDYVSKKARVSDLVMCQGGKGSIEEKMSIFQLSNDCRSWHIMHQSIPPAPSPPQATAGHLPALSVPGVGHLQMLHCPGAGHLPTPGPIPSF